MSGFLYDALTGAITALVAVGVFLISLAVLDILAWLTVVLLTTVSATFERAARVRSALGAMREHERR